MPPCPFKRMLGCYRVHVFKEHIIQLCSVLISVDTNIKLCTCTPSKFN